MLDKIEKKIAEYTAAKDQLLGRAQYCMGGIDALKALKADVETAMIGADDCPACDDAGVEYDNPKSDEEIALAALMEDPDV